MHMTQPASTRSCPSCGAKILLRSRASQAKLRCPKCLETIPAGAEGMAAPSEGRPGEVEELRRALEEMAAEVRRLGGEAESHKKQLLAFEQELAGLRGGPALPKAGVQIVVPPPSKAPEGRRLDDRQRATLVELLRMDRPSALTIKCPLDDDEALRFAQALRSVYAAAGWRVGEPIRCKFQPRRRGLVIAAGELPAPPEVVQTFKAFREAGLKATTCLDLDQLREKLILWVGPV